MIYDCFTFFNELDILEIRLNILYSVVDKFVLVEADRTHTNKQKPFYFAENKTRYSRFLDKIIHIQITEYPMNPEIPLVLENYQRDQIVQGLKDCVQDDIILISDVDEIPNPKVIFDYKKNGKNTCILKQALFCYYLNSRVMFKFFYLAKITKYKYLCNPPAASLYRLLNVSDHPPDKYTPNQMRMGRGFKIIKNAGWHFTFLGGMEAIKYKMQSYLHQEFNNEKYVNNEIETKMKLGLDLFGKSDWRLIPVKITNKKYPEYIVDNQDKYAHFIYPYNISRYIVIKNTVFSLLPFARLFRMFKDIIIKFAKIILPKKIKDKIKNKLKAGK